MPELDRATAQVLHDDAVARVVVVVPRATGC
jgi:hypothetical protein